MHKMVELTQEYLLSVLEYHEDTGHFTWKKKTASSVKIGEIAGGINSNGYWRISLLNRKWMAHRLAFLYVNGEFPNHEIDHLNHRPDDNRWCNLREVTHQENSKNQKLRTTNKSGFTGVLFDKNRWRAEITVSGKNKFLGYYNTIYGAITARKIAEVEHNYHTNHGEVSC